MKTKRGCVSPHGDIELIVIATDGFPLETFIGRPFINFLRRLLHGHHRECKTCYQKRTGVKIA